MLLPYQAPPSICLYFNYNILNDIIVKSKHWIVLDHYSHINFDEVKKERKEKELSEKYKKEFDSGKFEELINEKYRYYRADFECMSVKNYPAQPKF